MKEEKLENKNKAPIEEDNFGDILSKNNNFSKFVTEFNGFVGQNKIDISFHLKIKNLLGEVKKNEYREKTGDIQLLLNESEDEISNELKDLTLSFVNNFTVEFDKTLNKVYGGKTENYLCDYSKIEGALEFFKKNYISKGKDSNDDLLDAYSWLTKEEIEELSRSIIILPIYSKYLSEELLGRIFHYDIENGVKLDINKYWNHGDQKIDKINPDQNEKTIEALKNAFSSSDAYLLDREKMLEELVDQNLFGFLGMYRDMSQTERKSILDLFQSLLNDSEIKGFVEKKIINYWFEWSDDMKDLCENMDFNNLGGENVREIISLLNLSEAVYKILIESGMQPNEDYADFMLEYMKKCQEADNYYLEVKTKKAIKDIEEYSDDYGVEYINGREKRKRGDVVIIDDYKKAGSRNLIIRAIDTLDLNFGNEEYQTNNLVDLNNLSFIKLGGRNYYRYNPAPEIVGYYDEQFNLIKIEENKEIVNFKNLRKINYGDGIKIDDFYDIIYLQNLKVKELINKDFNIDLSELSFRIQNQFLNFIKNSSKSKINEIKIFVNEGENKIERIKTFLSLESGDITGTDIIGIGKYFNDDQESVNQLFSVYSSIVDGAERDTEELMKMYNEIFHDKHIDQEKANNAILQKAFKLLRNASEELKKNKNKKDREDVLMEVVAQLHREEKILKNIFSNFKKMANEMNGVYREVNKKYSEFVNNLELKETENEMILEELDRKDIDDYLEYVSWLQNNEFDPALAYTANEFIEMENREMRSKYFDSERLRKMIDEMRDFLKEHYSEKVSQWISDFEKYLDFQISFETKLDEFVYGSQKEEVEDENPIFKKYQEIIDQAQKTSRKDLEEFFSKETDVKSDDIERVVDLILEKANKFLKGALGEVLSGEEESVVLEKLNSFRIDVAVFGSIFQAAYKEDDLNFEEIKGIDYLSLDSGLLTEDQKELIINLVKSNYPKKTQREDVLRKIEESFNNGEGSKWHLLLREKEGREELLSCIRFDELDESSVYGASFNVDRSYQGFNIGEAMNNRVLDEVAKEKRIFAIAEIQKKVTKSYLNKGGFNVSGIEKNKKTGIYYYNIERYDPENEFYSSKKTEDELLMSYYDPNKKIEEQINFQKYILIKKENQNFNDNIEEVISLMDNNYLMTKIITQQDGEIEKNYYVFEKRINMELGKNNEAA